MKDAVNIFWFRRDLRLDYSKPQVRKHYLDTFCEACRRYDLHGIELDWLRSPVLMTAFVRESRAIVSV